MHELEIVDGQAHMAWSGKTPWHGLGTEVPGDLSPIQIMEAANLDWTVEKIPAYADIDGNRVSVGKSALVRSSDNSILDVVSTDWEPLQNLQAFEFFNDFIEEGSMQMNVAGSLRAGQIVWALAKTNEGFSVSNGKDHVESYLLFTNPHKFGKSIDVRMTSVRVVCNNTLTLALNNASSNVVKVSHKSPFNAETVKETMGLAQLKTENYHEMADFLSKKMYKEEDVVNYFKRIFPLLSDKKTEKLSKNAKMGMDILETQPGFDMSPGSFWQLYNGTTYMTNHLLGRNPDNRVNSLFYGSSKELNIKALKTAVEMAS